MTVTGPVLKAGGPSNLLRKSVPPPPLRGACGGPDNRPGDRLRDDVLNVGGIDLEDVMTLFTTIETRSNDAYLTLVAGLETQFHDTEIDAVAALFIDAEAADFYWESRINERYLGSFESDGDGDLELDRIAIAGLFRCRWFTAICLVDGDGMVHWMRHLRDVKTREAAMAALAAVS